MTDQTETLREALGQLLPEWERAWDALLRASSDPPLITRERHFAQFMEAALATRPATGITGNPEWAAMMDYEAQFDQTPCRFGPPHEPFYCRIHGDVRLTLDADHCRTTTPPAAGLDWPTLANIIREVDGNHDLGAGELAQRIIEHPRFR